MTVSRVFPDEVRHLRVTHWPVPVGTQKPLTSQTAPMEPSATYGSLQPSTATLPCSCPPYCRTTTFDNWPEKVGTPQSGRYAEYNRTFRNVYI